MDVEIVGRDSELEAIERWLDGPLPSTLLIEGEPGIGKTTLWREAVARAERRELRVLPCALSENEAQLAFAGLSDLVRPYLDDELSSLAPPQARALEEALLLRESPQGLPDERDVAFGFLGLVIQLARRAPLAIAVDDIQWLDASSLTVLRFGVRRLRMEQVAFLVARRIDGGSETSPGRIDFEEPERIEVGPLSPGALHRLLATRLGHPLTRPALNRIHVASHGNPLHALELARVLDGRSSGEVGSIARPLHTRVAALPNDALDALALAAFASIPSVPQLSRAVGEDVVVALQPAIDADLVFVDRDRVRFTHPLVASAARDVVGERGPELHRALAGVSESVEDRARHLGRATREPDDDIAQTLEDAAHEVRKRGARSVAAELYEDSARLTTDGSAQERGRRLLEAGWASWEAGDPEHAKTLLAEVAETVPDGATRCEALGRLGVAVAVAGGWREAQDLWKEALAASDDPGLRAEVGRWMAVTSAATGTAEEAERFAAEAVADAERSADDRRIAYALAVQAFIAALAGDEGYRPLIDRALALDSGLHGGFAEWSPTWFAAECARHAGDVEASRRLYRVLLDDAVEHGDASVEVVAAYGLASAELLGGDLAHADPLADTVVEIAEQTGTMRIPALSLRAQVDAHLGRAASARELLTTVEAMAEAAGDRINHFTTCAVLGFLHLSEGDIATAADWYARARELADALGFRSAVALRNFSYEVEAAAAANRLDQANIALEAFDRLTGGKPPQWAAVVHGRALASLSTAHGDLDAAEAQLERALEEDDGTMPLERARTLLALGALQRRARKRAKARATLQLALTIFDERGAELWAARARTELGRIGGRVSGGGELTATEERVAELVAEGKSNKEVATALVLSVHTVEAALTSIYRKLDLRSRTELAHKLAKPTASKE